MKEHIKPIRPMSQIIGGLLGRAAGQLKEGIKDPTAGFTMLKITASEMIASISANMDQCTREYDALRRAREEVKKTVASAVVQTPAPEPIKTANSALPVPVNSAATPLTC